MSVRRVHQVRLGTSGTRNLQLVIFLKFLINELKKLARVRHVPGTRRTRRAAGSIGDRGPARRVGKAASSRGCAVIVISSWTKPRCRPASARSPTCDRFFCRAVSNATPRGRRAEAPDSCWRLSWCSCARPLRAPRGRPFGPPELQRTGGPAASRQAASGRAQETPRQFPATGASRTAVLPIVSPQPNPLNARAALRRRARQGERAR